MKTSSSHYVDRAYHRMKEMITNHEIKPNQPMHISQLSELLNLSTTPVREALNRLLNDGFVVRGRHRGFQSRPIDLQEHGELFDFRVVLLCWAIRLLLEETPAERVDLLVASWQTQMNRRAEGALSHALENSLFDNIMEIIDNREIKRLYSNCMERCGYMWRTFMSREQQRDAFLARQQRLVDQIAARSLPGCLELINQCRQLLNHELKELEKSEHAHLLYITRPSRAENIGRNSSVHWQMPGVSNIMVPTNAFQNA